jgi:hypothetical protein
MPRFLKIEKITINADQTSTDTTIDDTLNQVILSAAISFNTYYDKTDYEKN